MKFSKELIKLKLKCPMCKENLELVDNETDNFVNGYKLYDYWVCKKCKECYVVVIEVKNNIYCIKCTKSLFNNGIKSIKK